MNKENNNNKLDTEIDRYIKNTWSSIIDDLSNLIKIKSFIDDSNVEVDKQYPNGKNQAKALNYVLKLSKKMGFSVINHKNMIGIADIKGKSHKKIGFIGHLDVVNESSNWQFNPYKLTIKDNYLLGRGIVDDKGPTILLLYAINYWIEHNYQFPYSIRCLFGTDEESGSTDVKEYLNCFQEPDILITPDANFPICYGEKGLLRFKIVSEQILNGSIISAFAGTCDNAISGKATITIKTKNNLNIDDFILTHTIKIEKIENDIYKVTAKGRSSHASKPNDGIDSLAILSRFILHNKIGNSQEQEFFKFISKIAGKPNGASIGINCQSHHFKKLTIIPSMLRFENGKLGQIFDVRYPENTNAKKILAQIKEHLPKNADIIYLTDSKPLLLNPNSNLINALSKAYESVIHKKAEKFTIGGATYAKSFKNAISFGPQMDWVPKPAWVGNIHGPNEGISEENLKETFKIYIYLIYYLMNLNLDSLNFYKDIHLNNE